MMHADGKRCPLCPPVKRVRGDLAVMDAAIARNGHRGDSPDELAMQRRVRNRVATLMTLANNACDVESIDALRKHVADMEGAP